MRALVCLWTRVKAIFTTSTINREIDEELRLHVDLLTEEFERGGMTHEEARRAARRRFGNSLVIREQGLDIRETDPAGSSR